LENKNNLRVEIDNLKKSFGSVGALAGVSTKFETGKLNGVVGPEGAGKTTLFRLITGLLKIDSGEISFLRGSKRVEFTSVRSGIAYMPQTQSLYPDLSIREHLDFFKELYQISDEVYEKRTEELLHITRLKRFEDRSAGKLSGGMYKKLGLMCSMLQSPLLMLLDEPTNGVDPISRREFWELLYLLINQGILIVVSTAYMDEAERCGVVHVVSEGELVASGEPRALLQDEKARDFEEFFIKKTSGSAK